MDVAAYALGVLDEQDTERFESISPPAGPAPPSWRRWCRWWGCSPTSTARR
ncbi:hypothetical protein NKG94_23530 [Micromonospora sp. M12]